MKIRSLVVVLSLSLALVAQGQWTRQSPLPTARNLWGAAWATPTHGFASGESETLVETFDGGATWHNVNLGVSPSDPFYNVYCRDADNCFVVGNGTTNGPDHWRTTDGGATWQQINNFPLGGSWRQVDFVSASVGFMGSNGATAHTTDGGATWTLMSLFPDCPVIYGMDFRDMQVGLAAGDRVSTIDGGPGIFKTTDAGVTWVRKSAQTASDVLWLNNTTAIASVLGPVYRSTDAGETWSEISSQVSTGGFDKMALLPNGTIVGVSGVGDAWRSADGGFSWTQTLVGLGALPASWNVSFFDNQIGMIVGQSGFIFKTTDGGVTWTMLNKGIGVEFRDLEMFDDSAGLAVGDDGYFVRTEDGGNHWKTGRLQVTGVVVGRNEHLQAVNIVDANFAVAAGFDGVAYKTFDRGATWQSIGYPNLSGDLFIRDVKFINHNLGYVTGSHPGSAEIMFRTSDGGATWQPVNAAGEQSLDFVDANHGWVMGPHGTGSRTTDGGATWQQMLLPDQGFIPTYLKLDFASQNDGWAVGWDGYGAHTTNGGATWQPQNIASSQDVIIGLHVLNGIEAFAVGRSSVGSGTFYHTINAGATWTTSPLPSQYSLSSIFSTSSRKVWASGYDGTILFNSDSPGPTATPTPVATPSATPAATPTPVATPSATPATTSTPVATPTATPGAPTPSPTATASPSTPPSPGLFQAPWRGFDTGVFGNGFGPASFAVGDLDGDGHPDILVGDSFFGSTGISVLKNNGDRTFAAPVYYPLPQSQTVGEVALADFDSDGDLDAFATIRGDFDELLKIKVWRNNGNGTFSAPIEFPTGQGPAGIVVADFTGDGKPDVVTANAGASSISILKNNGLAGASAGFLAPVSFSTGNRAEKIAAADVNGDGKLDVVIGGQVGTGSGASLAVMINNGAGGFNAAVAYDAGGDFGSKAVALADLDNDGDIDLIGGASFIVGSGGYSAATIRRNTGNGTFGPAEIIAFNDFAPTPKELSTGDINGDGFADIVAAVPSGRATEGFVAVTSNGSGGFNAPVYYEGSQQTFDVAVFDVDGDGDRDVVTVANSSAAITVHENPGNGSFRVLPRYEVASMSDAVESADIDNDGDIDIVVNGGVDIASNDPLVKILKNNGDGTFAPAIDYTPARNFGDLKLRDINGDGLVDMLFAPDGNYPPFHFGTALNLGNGTFAPTVVTNVFSCGEGTIDAADLDGDGDLDIVLTEEESCPFAAVHIFVFRNDGNQNFTRMPDIVASSLPHGLALADVTGDGKIDVITAQAEGMAVYPGNEDLTFGTAIFSTTRPYKFKMADFNGDGKLDVGMIMQQDSFGTDTIATALGNGNGTFQAIRTQTGSSVLENLRISDDLETGDVNGDGRPDIVTFNYASNDVSVFLSNADGSLRPHQRYGIGNTPRLGTLADFDGDGRIDIAAEIGLPPSGLHNAIVILRHTVTGTPTPTPTPTVTPTGTPTATPTGTPGATPTPTPTGTPVATPTPTPAAQALNLSTRMRVETGDNVGIGGFIITGSAPKHVLLRAIGPSLTQFSVPGPLADPVMELHGPSGFVTVTNDNWREDPAQETLIQATGIAPTSNLEAAIMATLAPGAYTGIVRGKNNTSGVALIEVYDLSQAVLAKLANISTRAFVSTGDDIVIAGFTLGGNSGSDRVVVRGIGPSLASAGVANALADPTLELRDRNGALLITNNNWQDNPAQAAELTAAGLAPTNNLESGIAATLPPGAYTALLAGVNNGTGIGVVEVYDRGATP